MPRLSDTSNETLAAKLPSTTTLIERLIALGGFACLLVGVALVLRPFVTGILFGSIIVIATWPIRDWLVRHGLSVGLTATVLLLVALGTVGVPAIILAPGLGERLVDGIQRLQAYFAGSPELPNWVAQVPWAKESVARLWSSLAEPGSAFQTVIKPYSAELRKGLIELARAFAEGMFQFVVSLAVATMLMAARRCAGWNSEGNHGAVGWLGSRLGFAFSSKFSARGCLRRHGTADLLRNLPARDE